MNDRTESGVGDVLHKAEDAVGGAVGMASAVIGGHSAAMFVQNARISDLYEIEAARTALCRSQSPYVRRFAQTMIDDHENSIQQLSKAVRGKDVEAKLPARIDKRRRAMIEHLAEASDQEFDRTYLSQQKEAHREALTLFEGYASSGEGSPLGAYASGAIPVLRQHHEMLEALPGA